MSGIFGALVGQCQGVVHFQVLRLVSQCQVSSDFRKQKPTIIIMTTTTTATTNKSIPRHVETFTYILNVTYNFETCVGYKSFWKEHV